MEGSYEIVRPDEPKSGGRGFLYTIITLIVAIVFIYIFYEEAPEDVEIKSDINNVLLPNEPSKLNQEPQSDLNGEPLNPVAILELQSRYDVTVQKLKEDHADETQRLSKEILILQQYISELETKTEGLQEKVKGLELDLRISNLALQTSELTLAQQRTKISESQKEDKVTKEKTLSTKKEKTDAPQPSIETTKFKLIFAPPPAYPRRAQERGREGSATVEFTILTSGQVVNVRLLRESPEGWGFGRAAIKAAKGLRYTPSTKNGVAVATDQVNRAYKFTISN